MTYTISIIIPTLNEAENIPALRPLLAQVSEVIVVDGGSNDSTVELAEKSGMTVLCSDRGRGAQLNKGAAYASSDILLFLHADTQLPKPFPKLIRDCLGPSKVTLGAFSLAVKPSSPSMAFICAGANIRSSLFQLPYGDQALFIRKSLFEELGGFPELPIMEDYLFVKRARSKGSITTLPHTVTTSARRWQKLGPLRTTWTNQLMLLGYSLGVSPERLALFYRSRGQGVFRRLIGKLRGNKGANTIL